MARERFHAVLGDVAVATEALQRVVGALNAPFGEAGLGDRGQEAEQGVGLRALVRIRGRGDDVHQRRGVVAEQAARSEEHTSELQSLMRSAYAVYCSKKKKLTSEKKTT